MEEWPAQLDELCQTAALLVVRHPYQRDEIEAEIADVLCVPLDIVQEHVVKRLSGLSSIECQEPPRPV